MQIDKEGEKSASEIISIPEKIPSQIVIDDKLTITRLGHMRNKLINLRGGSTWNQVIFYLLEQEIKVVAFESKIQSLKGKVKQTKEIHHEETKEYLRLSLTRPAAQMMALAQANSGSSLSPPPPPPPPFLKKKYRAPNTKNLRKDYVIEVQSVFTGQPRKPTDIIQQTQPKFAEQELIEIDDDFEIPKLDIISILDVEVEIVAMKTKKIKH
jgi:hypothetical protein